MQEAKLVECLETVREAMKSKTREQSNKLLMSVQVRLFRELIMKKEQRRVREMVEDLEPENILKGMLDA
jgi:hypothetical protein